VYHTLFDEQRKEEKLQWFNENKFKDICFEQIAPDKNNNWINLTDNDFESLIPLIDKNVKAGKSNKAVFNLFANGLETGRDEWLYDFSEDNLLKKVNYYSRVYNQSVDNKTLDFSISWNRDLKSLYSRNIKVEIDKSLFIKSHFRPFTNKFYYADVNLNYLLTTFHYSFFGKNIDKTNKVIVFSGTSFNQPFHSIVVKNLTERHFVEKSQCLPLYRYDKSGSSIENITDWGLEQFRNNYELKKNETVSKKAKKKSETKTITKEDIFHYTYGVLHNPAYRKKYELNLKREFPRIPMYKDFWQWAAWGKELMNLHIDYETVEPYKLELIQQSPKLTKKQEKQLFEQPETFVENLYVNDDFVPKAKLKADKESGIIIIDELTTLKGIPKEAWEYKLGIRSAMEWVLDQYKESTPSDPTIKEKFNTYKFADYKDLVIDLLKRVCTVSVRTVEIIKEMEKNEE
jgi:predicted helicase